MRQNGVTFELCENVKEAIIKFRRINPITIREFEEGDP